MFIADITDKEICSDLLHSGLEDDSCGGIVIFEGRVRDHNEGRAVRRLFYECYQPMAKRILEGIVRHAAMTWPISKIRLLHRIGEIPIGEIAVWIGVAAEHRHEAFAACQFLIEEVKKKVPIWKHETYEDGRQEWVACHHA